MHGICFSMVPSSNVEDQLASLRKENTKLHRLVFEERKKSLEERQKRLRLEVWFRQHLHQCKTKVGEFSKEKEFADVASQTDLADSGKQSFTTGSSIPKKSARKSRIYSKTVTSLGSSFANFNGESVSASVMIGEGRRSEEKAKQSYGKEVSLVPTRKTSLGTRIRHVTQNEDPASTSSESHLSGNVKTSLAMPTASKGLYFIDMNGVINRETNLNPKAMDRMKSFVKRSLERQRKIKDATLLRQRMASEKLEVLSKLLSGEAHASDALYLFGKPPISAFSSGRIAKETKARFQQTFEYRKNLAAQLEISHRKWNRLHAFCFSEALRFRIAPDNFWHGFDSSRKQY